VCISTYYLIHKQEAVARGAAQHAATLIGLIAEVGKDYDITDRAPLSLGIEMEGGVMMTVRLEVAAITAMGCLFRYDADLSGIFFLPDNRERVVDSLVATGN